MLARQGKKDIKSLAASNKPLLSSLAQYYWQAFAILNHARQVGVNGPNPISLAEINHYCQLFSVRDDEENTLIVRFIQALDREYLNHYAHK